MLVQEKFNYSFNYCPQRLLYGASADSACSVQRTHEFDAIAFMSNAKSKFGPPFFFYETLFDDFIR